MCLGPLNRGKMGLALLPKVWGRGQLLVCGANDALMSLWDSSAVMSIGLPIPCSKRKPLSLES